VEDTVRRPLVAICVSVLACCAVTHPRPAAAQIIVDPGPINATVPAMIPIVGHDAAGVPDPIGEFTVSVRDLANNPVAGAAIVIDFSQCTELRLCASDHDPNVIVDCANRRVMRTADASGTARFRVMGWSTAGPAGPGAPYNSAHIFADGVLLNHPSVAIHDLDTGGLGAQDLSRWLADFFSGQNLARDDYDATQTVGVSDLSMWLKAYFAAGSPANCSPEGPCP
jgi:hypothetical protein